MPQGGTIGLRQI